MKKSVILLLVAAMVLTPLIGIALYLRYYGGSNDDLFSDIPQPVIGSDRFLDLRGHNVSAADFSADGDIFYTFTFDTATQWPEDQKLPEPGLPSKLFEQGKYLGLGLRALKEKGITGRGVAVAVIDKPLFQAHEAFGSRIKYIEIGSADSDEEELSYHGAHVAGLLAGADGVAPDATLYYFAVHGGENSVARYAEAVNKLLEIQETLPEQDKVRVLAIAQGIESPFASDGMLELVDAITRARQQGIIVIYQGMSALPLTGAGCPPYLDRDDPQNYQLWSWTRAKRDVASKLKARGARSWEDAAYILKQMLLYEDSLDYLQAAAIETFLGIARIFRKDVKFSDWLAKVLSDSEAALAVPVDCVTLPNSLAENGYTYYGSGGLSWSIGYVAGLAALGVQVNPDVTEQQILDVLWETATPFQGSLRLPNPQAFIEKLSG